MKKILLPLFVILGNLMTVANVHALETDFLPDVKNGVVSIQIKEPSRDVGYTVGDVLTREITLTVKKPFVLVDESLPIVGYERRYKGQLIGIDLSHLEHKKDEASKATTHFISLSYQVFTNNVVAKPGALPAEYLRILDTSTKDNKVYRYRIPSWNFAISPISVFGQVKVEADMSGYRGPLLLDPEPQQMRLKGLLVILGLSLLGLVYMLGKHAWLPRMGGPFARAFKTIRKAPHSSEGVQTAVASIHQALNTTAGFSLFSNNLENFMDKKPAFNHIQTELNQFFELSRLVFFAPPPASFDSEQQLVWLANFCKQCRDCERGLIPDSIANTKAA